MNQELNIRWRTLKSPLEYEMTNLVNLLSIYSQTPFEIDEVRMESVAGFVIGLHFSEGNSQRKQSFLMWGYRAKVIARKINKHTDSIVWNGEKIGHGSARYYGLIEKAMRLKFEKNHNARKALLATKGLKLVSKDGPEKKYIILPSEKFCEIITKIRDEFVERYKLDFLIPRKLKISVKTFFRDFHASLPAL